MEVKTKSIEAGENNIGIEIMNFVEKESFRRDKGFHKEWMKHLRDVAENSLEMAEKLNADKEALFLSAWLHDVGNIFYHRKEDHHITGAKIAEKKLRELGYPEEKVQEVKHCIYSHRASKKILRESKEAQILADADSLAHFVEYEMLVKAEHVLGHERDEEKARKNVEAKMVRSWNRLSDEGKNFAKEKYPKILNRLEILK